MNLRNSMSNKIQPGLTDCIDRKKETKWGFIGSKEEGTLGAASKDTIQSFPSHPLELMKDPWGNPMEESVDASAYGQNPQKLGWDRITGDAANGPKTYSFDTKEHYPSRQDVWVNPLKNNADDYDTSTYAEHHFARESARIESQNIIDEDMTETEGSYAEQQYQQESARI